MASADGYVIPKPGIPKTLGILSVIFGVLMVLYGLCLTSALLAAPALMQFGEKTVKDAQAKLQANQDAQLKALDGREKAAKTDEEKAAIKQERDQVVASSPKMQTVDMGAATAQLKDPVVMGYSYLQLISGLLLSLLLLISGIGLIRLAPWGRSLSIAWAGLQILQLVVLSAASVFYVEPIQRANAEKMLAKMEADAKAPNAAPGLAESARMARALSGSGASMIMTGLYLIAGSFYPVVLLAMLNDKRARAALQGPKPPGPGEF